MLGAQPAPAELEIDWVLGQGGDEGMRARAGDAAFVRDASEPPSVRDGLRQRVRLGSEPCVERHRRAATAPERRREGLRARRRPLAKPPADLARGDPHRDEVMARAFRTGVDSMQEIADAFGVHDLTVARAVRRLQGAEGPGAANRSESGMLDCKTR